MMRDSISEDLPNPNNLKEQMKNANENNALNPFFKRVSAPFSSCGGVCGNGGSYLSFT